MQAQFPPPVPIVLLVVQGFFSPTTLQILHGPWINDRCLLCRN